MSDSLMDLDAGHYVKHSSLQNVLAKEILSSCSLYIKGWLNSYVCLPESLHASFLDDVGRAVINDPAIMQRGEGMDIPYTALVIKIRKTTED